MSLLYTWSVTRARRVAALETGQSQQPSPRHAQPHDNRQKGLSKNDAAIAERLQKLKEATKPGPTDLWCITAADVLTVLSDIVYGLLLCVR